MQLEQREGFWSPPTSERWALVGSRRAVGSGVGRRRGALRLRLAPKRNPRLKTSVIQLKFWPFIDFLQLLLGLQS